MIKSDLGIYSPDVKPEDYPFLGKYRSSNYDLVVLFSCPRVGTVVLTNAKEWRVGDYQVGWADMSEWTILPPGSTVTLEQL